MADDPKSGATLAALQQALEYAEISVSERKGDETAVENMMTAARSMTDQHPDLADLRAQKAAAETALAILAADPATGPVVVKYIASDEDVHDSRFLIVLFGERGFLFDRIAGKTTIIPLDDGGRSGAERHAAIVESAKAAAAREKLSAVYVVRR
jgi:hypothetical protein